MFIISVSTLFCERFYFPFFLNLVNEGHFTFPFFLTKTLCRPTIVLNRTDLNRTNRIEPIKMGPREKKRGGLTMHFWDRHKTITAYYETLTRSVCDKYQLTQMEYDILMFLYSNPQYHTAADIVNVRKSTKSHVSTSLKHLEERGLVEKKKSPDNKKYYEIYLLDDAKIIIDEGLVLQEKFRKKMFQGLTDEEMVMWKAIFKKICNNAEACLKEENN